MTLIGEISSKSHTASQPVSGFPPFQAVASGFVPDFVPPHQSEALFRSGIWPSLWRNLNINVKPLFRFGPNLRCTRLN